jgi:hypothetical protein
MDYQTIAVIARHLERLMIVLAGAMAIVLGYRMFLAIPRPLEAAETGEGKLELPGGVSIYVTRVGPGVFFALFGAVILALALYHGLKVQEREERPATAAQGAAGGAAASTVVTERSVSSAVSGGASPQQREAERVNALSTVGQLARLATVLDGPGGRSIPQRIDFGLALTDARMRLLATVWDEQVWGPHGDFIRWVQNGETGPPPPRAAAAAQAYRGQR